MNSWTTAATPSPLRYRAITSICLGSVRARTAQLICNRCVYDAQLMALTVASSLQLGPTWVAQYAIIMSMAGFYAAQWEECVLH